MEKTTLISGNGFPYERNIPEVRILTFINDVALENLRRQTGIDFQKNGWGVLSGKPETWEQFAKIFLTYNWLTHDQNNWDGNVMYLRGDCNTPLNCALTYEQNGQRFLGVDTFRSC